MPGERVLNVIDFGPPDPEVGNHHVLRGHETIRTRNEADRADNTRVEAAADSAQSQQGQFTGQQSGQQGGQHRGGQQGQRGGQQYQQGGQRDDTRHYAPNSTDI